MVFFCFRDAHFVIGEEDEKKTEEDDKIFSDPKYVAFIQLDSVVYNKTTNDAQNK